MALPTTFNQGIWSQLGQRDPFGISAQEARDRLDSYRQQHRLDALRYRTDMMISSPFGVFLNATTDETPKTFRQQLQSEIDEWLK